MQTNSHKVKCLFCRKYFKFHSEGDRKLHTIKCALNNITPILNNIIPPLQPSIPITKLVERIFAEVKKNLQMHPSQFYQDHNFPIFIDTTEKALIYIAENDGHYRGWLAYFLLAVMDIMNQTYINFNYKGYYKRNKARFPKLKIKSKHAKPILFYDWLTQHPTRFIIRRES